MRSGELARLAGVSVRALRHYHQVGVLAEPDRNSNGYRDYDVHDLVRVLRVKRLAALGVPLERMPEILDGDAGEDGGRTTADLLDDLDRELADRMARIARQREVIALLRAHRSAPDVPPELAPFLAAFATAGLPADVVRLDRDQSVLLAHFAGEEGMAGLARFYERLSSPALFPVVAAVSDGFARLGPHTTDEEIATFAETFAAALGPEIGELGGTESALDLGDAADMLGRHTDDLLNDQQRRALHRLAELLDPAG
ncbi:MerR family transcriptional regulator [Streptomyces lonarensis]|uniref:MerR family transcriptional regulator n=1 Tax=Streptomyces lonarensis TaxID=700599 RepID=A0A7X6HY95_9ACTN|nr:MerR family transcriptional regulator [Streptomyces lonarensis]NJQ05366.1 MerR family transcriptional regulator [Streptomyces lonarensis]